MTCFEVSPNWINIKETFLTKGFEKFNMSFDATHPAHQIIALDHSEFLSKHLVGLLNDSFLILSLSTKRDNALMWAHYTNANKGFVIGFDPALPIFHNANKLVFPDSDKLQEVHYSRTRYVVPVDALNGVTVALERELVRGCLFTKSVDWSYESEVRLVAHPSSATQVLNPKDTCPIFLFEFTSESVKEVILGHKIEDCQADIIAELLRTRYKDAKLMRAYPSDSKFDLEIL